MNYWCSSWMLQEPCHLYCLCFTLQIFRYTLEGALWQGPLPSKIPIYTGQASVSCFCTFILDQNEKQFSQKAKAATVFAVGWILVGSCVIPSQKHLVCLAPPSDFTDVPLRDDQQDYLCKIADEWGRNQCRYAGKCHSFSKSLVSNLHYCVMTWLLLSNFCNCCGAV
jgi:hypothetical protein